MAVIRKKYLIIIKHWNLFLHDFLLALQFGKCISLRYCGKNTSGDPKSLGATHTRAVRLCLNTPVNKISLA